jgi:oligogalacturonide lyase
MRKVTRPGAQMLRAPLANERIEKLDPVTGTMVIQVTSYPTPSRHLMYDWPSVTPDNRRVVFLCQRWTERSAPWDIFRCDTDGMNLFQLTRREDVAATPALILSLDGTTVYAVWGTENILWAIDVETGSLERVCDLSRFARSDSGWAGIYQAPGGRRLYLGRRDYQHGTGSVIGVDLAPGKAQVILEDTVLYACDQALGRLVVIRNFMTLGLRTDPDGTRKYTNLNKDPMQIWSIREDGSDEQYRGIVDMFGHSTLLGRTSVIQGTDQHQGNCIWMAEPGKDPWKLVEGHHFWHAGPSFDGEWIVSDTNWPDEGIKLVHVPSRHFRTLCYAGASQGATQSGHCHPALSHDGRIAVFGSDRTGVPQVYVALITDEFRERVKRGDPD